MLERMRLGYENRRENERWEKGGEVRKNERMRTGER